MFTMETMKDRRIEMSILVEGKVRGGRRMSSGWSWWKGWWLPEIGLRYVVHDDKFAVLYQHSSLVDSLKCECWETVKETRLST